MPHFLTDQRVAYLSIGGLSREKHAAQQREAILRSRKDKKYVEKNEKPGCTTSEREKENKKMIQKENLVYTFG